MKLLTLIVTFAIPFAVQSKVAGQAQIHWHESTKLMFELPESWSFSEIRDRSFRLAHEDPKSDPDFRAYTTPEVTFKFHPYPPGQNRASVSAQYNNSDARNPFKKVEIAGVAGFIGSRTRGLLHQKGAKKLEIDIIQKMHIVPLEKELLVIIAKCPIESWDREKESVASLLTKLTFSESPPKGAVTLAPKRPKPIILVDKDIPYNKKHSLEEGDVLVYRLPNGKDVSLWVEVDKLAFGEQVTKSGLQCWWGEKPFEFAPKKEIRQPDGRVTTESTSYIEQGAVITSTQANTTEHELQIGKWNFSYINDLGSHPKLNVTVKISNQ